MLGTFLGLMPPTFLNPAVEKAFSKSLPDTIHNIQYLWYLRVDKRLKRSGFDFERLINQPKIYDYFSDTYICLQKMFCLEFVNRDRETGFGRLNWHSLLLHVFLFLPKSCHAVASPMSHLDWSAKWTIDSNYDSIS
ncbi:MAG: hypothetical protein D6732_08170 [Methanobacteriota archaeon]|nr:MAG: hypothetical protein D6732_08170 [Euryarchaeota archaeon]